MNNSRRMLLKSSAAALLGAAMDRLAFAEEPIAQNKSTTAPSVASVRNLGQQFLGSQSVITGADGATSTVLPSGDALWLFGDTVEEPFQSIRTLNLTALRSSTAAIVPRQDASNGISQFQFLTVDDKKRPRQIVPFESGEDPAQNRIWAIHGVTVGSDIYLYYHRITMLKGVDVFTNFKLDGMGIAKANAEELRFVRLTAPDGTREFWKGDQPTFGVFVTRASEYAYLWGCLMTGMFLARVKPAAIADLAEYEYLVEAPTLRQPDRQPKWSRQFAPTAPLFDSVPNEMSAAYNPHLRRFVAFHSLQRENKIVMRTAEQLEGPWSEPIVVYEPQRKDAADLIYAVKEHPELATEEGRIVYVTFVNSATYIPQMIEIEFK